MLDLRISTRLMNVAVAVLLLAAVPGCGGGSSDASPPRTETPEQKSGAQPQPPSEADPDPTVSPKPLPAAILPFDSDDPSIILRSTLTSPDEITTAGGSEEPTSANSFDPVLGMQPAAVPGGVAGCRFTSSSIPALADLPEGQLSIEVQREWLSIADPNIRSTGALHGANEYLLSFTNYGKVNAGKLYVDTDQYITWLYRAGEGSRRARIVNTKLSPDYARITLSWTESDAALFIDGLLIGSLPRTAVNTDNLSQLFIGNFVGTTDSTFSSPYYVRSLLVSSKPVQFSSAPLLRHVMLVGDSFAAGQPFFNIPDKYDGTIANSIIRNLSLQHLSMQEFSVFSNGGGKIQDVSNDPLEADMDGAGLSRADVLRESPSIIIFVTGGNDIEIFDYSTFTIDLHDHLEAFLGENGYADTTTEKVILTTTVSNTYSSSATVHSMVDIMRETVNWWNLKYPDRKGAVHILDSWLLFGGDNVDKTLFLLNDPIHPAPAGNIIYGQAITDKILQLLHEQETTS